MERLDEGVRERLGSDGAIDARVVRNIEIREDGKGPGEHFSYEYRVDAAC